MSLSSQRVHVGIWYILHIPTLRPKYIPYTYMDLLGLFKRMNNPAPDPANYERRKKPFRSAVAL